MVGLDALGRGLDGGLSGVPVGGADLYVISRIRRGGLYCKGVRTSPYLSVNWKASIRRRVSSTLRPTGRSLMVI